MATFYVQLYGTEFWGITPDEVIAKVERYELTCTHRLKSFMVYQIGDGGAY